MNPRVLLAVLLVASAVVFAIGVSVEKSQTATTHTDSPIAGTNAPEGSAAREAAEGKSPIAGSGGEPSANESERFVGINTESTPLVVLVVVATFILAGAALYLRSQPLLALILVVALLAFLFDMREVVHQFQENRDTVATLAVVTGGLHVLAAFVAATMLLERKIGPVKPA
jgi:hypothetical protein